MKVLEHLLNHKEKLIYSLFCATYFFIHTTVLSVSTVAGTESYSPAKERAQFIYLALGDSLTAGLGASETNYLRLTAFVPQLTSYLRQSQSVYVENHGIPGLTSAQLSTYLQSGLGVREKIKEADLITITIGGNDLLQWLDRIETAEMNQVETEKIIQQFGKHVTEALALINSYNTEVPIYIMDLYSPYAVQHPLHEFSQQVVRSFNDELHKLVAAHQQVKVVSVYEAFLNQEMSLTQMDQNDIHPNDKGYQIIFDAFRKSIIQ